MLRFLSFLGPALIALYLSGVTPRLRPGACLSRRRADHVRARHAFPAGWARPTDVALFEKVQALQAKLVPARLVIARDYIDGRIDRDQALGLIERYSVLTPALAQQSLRFIDTYRSYVLNYYLGRAMVAKTMEDAGDDPAKRWARFEELIGQPTTPNELKPLWKLDPRDWSKATAAEPVKSLPAPKRNEPKFLCG